MKRASDRQLMWLAYTGFLLVYVVALAVMWTDCRGCEARGGTFVRTMFWFDCVEKKP